MTWLFDVNVLIAIVDPLNSFHGVIHGWLRRHERATWATCAITENGFIRVISQPAYMGTRRTPSDAIGLLRSMKESSARKHVFWADECSISDATKVIAERLVTSAQVTDVYLAALAAHKQGRLVTFDRNIPWQCVPGGSVGLIEIPQSEVGL